MIKLVAVFTLVFVGFFSEARKPSGDPIALHRVVYFRPLNQPEAEFRVFKERDFVTPNPQNASAIDTIWWDEGAGRMETFVMYRMRFDGRTFTAQVDYQRNAFPMDGKWDLVFRFPLKLKVNDSFAYTTKLGIYEFRIEMTLVRPAPAEMLINHGH